MRLSGVDMQTATGGHWHGLVPESVDRIVTDTRDFQLGEVFLALRGPNFDGHAFAASVADRALALIGDKAGVRLWADSGLTNNILEVDDTLQAFGTIAHAWRKRLQNTTVIAISGSYGKTSLRSLLQTGFTGLGLKVAATHANLNNLIGVPQTLLSVSQDADIAIIECGISECGEMAKLAAIVQPDVAVLTGMTEAHGEGLGGLSGVVSEKALLLAGADWCALGDGVEDLLVSNHIVPDQPCLSMHQGNADAVGWKLDGCELLLTYHDQQAAMTLALPAAHWAANLAFAAAVILRQSTASGEPVRLKAVVSALADWQPQAGRLQMLAGQNGSVLLDDSYNANPVSMQAAIDTLAALDGNKVVLLGDMAELGQIAASAHASLDLNGLDLTGRDRAYLIGDAMQVLAERYPEAGWFATTNAAIEALADVSFASSDTILIKASRSMGLEKIVQLLRVQEVQHAV